jgi:hypothetical protein
MPLKLMTFLDIQLPDVVMQSRYRMDTRFLKRKSATDDPTDSSQTLTYIPTVNNPYDAFSLVAKCDVQN